MKSKVRWGGVILLAVVMVTAAVGYAKWPRAAGLPWTPRDPFLRTAPVFLYPAADSTRPPSALLVFLGNDVGFWAPHRTLAWELSRSGLAVAGIDLRPLLRLLPREDSARANALRARLARIIAHARHELGADSVALLVGGHSLGAELAIWYAASDACGITGVLAMSPGARTHLAVTVSDLANRDPTGPGSYSVADLVRQVPPEVRVAIVRGTKDRYRRADPAFVASGASVSRFLVPLAGHSLKSVGLSQLVVRHAIAWLCANGRCANRSGAGVGS